MTSRPGLLWAAAPPWRTRTCSICSVRTPSLEPCTCRLLAHASAMPNAPSNASVAEHAPELDAKGEPFGNLPATASVRQPVPGLFSSRHSPLLLAHGVRSYSLINRAGCAASRRGCSVHGLILRIPSCIGPGGIPEAAGRRRGLQAQPIDAALPGHSWQDGLLSWSESRRADRGRVHRSTAVEQYFRRDSQCHASPVQ